MAFLLYVVVGFLAQMVDGALGMAYGVTCSAFLLWLGLPPAAASASVHAAKVLTCGASGASHLAFRNTDTRVVRALVLPGVVGAVLGAALASHVPVDLLRVGVACYLLGTGIRLARRALRPRSANAVAARPLGRLGFIGGLCDALGGGGWGPIVTPGLLSRDLEPRLAIGSANLAEFFVSAAASAVFVATIGITHWHVVGGLLLGGLLAAPLAAWSVRRIPTRALMWLVGVAIIALSLRTLVGAL